MALLSASCVPVETIELPAEAHHRSAILAVENSSLKVYAVDLTGGFSGALNFDRGTQLTLFLYDRTLVELGLPEGLIAPVSSPESTPIPEPDAPLHVWADGTWSLGQRSKLVDEFRYNAVNAQVCVELQGCFRDCDWCNDCENTCSEGGACPRGCYTPNIPRRALDPAPPEPPRPAFLPAECPAGWTVDAESCLPPASGVAACPLGQVLAGDFTCFAPDGSCGARFPQPTDPLARKLYVEAGGAGDGSEASPFGTLAEALAAASDGDAILLAAGRYMAGVDLEKRVELRGTCARDVRLVPGAIDTVLRAAAVGVALRDLTIEGGDRGLLVQPGAVLAIDAVTIAGTAIYGVLVESTGVLEARQLYLHDNGVVGIAGNAGARVRLERSAIVAQNGGGIIAHGGGTELDLTAVRVDGVRRNGDSVFGIHAIGAVVRAGDLLIEHSEEAGMRTESSTLTLENVVFRDLLRNAEDLGGGALYLDRTRANVKKMVVERAAIVALYTYNSFLDVSQLLSREAAIAGLENMVVIGASTAALSRIELRDVPGGGLLASGGSSAVLEDISVTGVSTGFIALAASDGSTMSVSRAALFGFLNGAGAYNASLQLRDARIEKMNRSARYPNEEAHGIIAQKSRLSVERATIYDQKGEGLAILNGSEAQVSGVRLDSIEKDGITIVEAHALIDRANLRLLEQRGIVIFGNTAVLDAEDVSIRGGKTSIVVEKGARLMLRASELLEFSNAGLKLDADTSNRVPPHATLVDADIRGPSNMLTCSSGPPTQPSLCIHTKSIEPDAITLEMNRFAISGCSTGMWVDGLAEVVLSEGTVRGNFVGLQVRSEHDAKSLFDTVVFENNCTHLDAVE